MPFVDGRNQSPRVEFANAGHMEVLKGRHAAERVLEGCAWSEVAVDGVLLLIGRSLGKLLDDALELVCCDRSAIDACQSGADRDGGGGAVLLTWVLHGARRNEAIVVRPVTVRMVSLPDGWEEQQAVVGLRDKLRQTRTDRKLQYTVRYG